jgi:hypothetical protein
VNVDYQLERLSALPVQMVFGYLTVLLVLGGWSLVIIGTCATRLVRSVCAWIDAKTREQEIETELGRDPRRKN